MLDFQEQTPIRMHYFIRCNKCGILAFFSWEEDRKVLYHIIDTHVAMHPKVKHNVRINQ